MFTLFDYQGDAVNSVFNYYRSGKKGNPIIVAPTGSGKTVIIAEICRRLLLKKGNIKILILSHNAEILEQNVKTIKSHTKQKVGIYSATLKSKEILNITAAGIQSIYTKQELLKDFDIIFIDEAHCVSSNKNSRYLKFLQNYKNPIIGLTATPFRLGTGYLHTDENSIFTDIVYKITYKKLQDSERLCQLTNKEPSIILDASQIKKQAGDYILKELSLAFDRNGITSEICKELLEYKAHRKKWLVYAIDINHAEHICQKLNDIGINSLSLSTKNSKFRKQILNKFRNEDYQAIVSVGMLTTGIDIPEVDLIALLRPTTSAGLLIQIIGRGLRIFLGKINCLVLDFAGNLKRCGDLDNPIIKVKGAKGESQLMQKTCHKCQEIVPLATRTCPSCKNEFEFKHNLTLIPDQDNLAKINWFSITETKYDIYYNKKNIPILRVNYRCGLRIFREFVCFDHGGYSMFYAKKWWQKNCMNSFIPNDSENALSNVHFLKEIKKILVDESGKYPEIIEFQFKNKAIMYLS